MTNLPKAKNIMMGNKFKATYQIFSWECDYCGTENHESQRVDEIDSLFDPLMYECGLCCKVHQVEKSILDGGNL